MPTSSNALTVRPKWRLYYPGGGVEAEIVIGFYKFRMGVLNVGAPVCEDWNYRIDLIHDDLVLEYLSPYFVAWGRVKSIREGKKKAREAILKFIQADEYDKKVGSTRRKLPR